MTTSAWVLCVDDEPRILRALALTLGAHLDVRTANSGAEALHMLAEQPGCGAVLSDMRMPEMDGAELLAKVREFSPLITRVLLTGQAEIESAIAAINVGGVYRFLTKPCPDELLLATVRESVEMYELRNAEKDLLEQTVNGIVLSMTDLLGIALPEGFSWASHSREALRELRVSLNMPASWELEAAAMLARIGWLALPSTTLSRYLRGVPLEERDAEQVERSADLVSMVLGRIPRFERIAQLITSANIVDITQVASDEMQLAAVLELERLVLADKPIEDINASLGAVFPPEIVKPLVLFCEGLTRIAGERTEVAIEALARGMVLAQDIELSDGSLVAKRGTELTDVLIQKMRNYGRNGSIIGEIQVWRSARIA